MPISLERLGGAAPHRRGGSRSPSGQPQQQFPLQEHVVVDAEPVDQRQILIDALDAERASVVDRPQLDRPAVDKDLPESGW